MKRLIKTIRLLPVSIIVAILVIGWAFDHVKAFPLGINSVYPAPNSHTANVNTDIVVDAAGVPDSTSVSGLTIPVQGVFSGRIVGNYTVIDDDVVFNPLASLFPGEQVKATLTEAVIIDNTPLENPYVWQFRTRILAGSGQFVWSQNLANEASMGAALGDLDGDGDLDAFIANGSVSTRVPTATTIWFNQGDGTFIDSGQLIDDPDGEDVALGDLDGDGDLDAVLAVDSYQGNAYFGYDLVMINDGHGYFTYYRLSSTEYNQTYGVDLGDLDGDGDLDVFLAHYYEGTAGHDGSEVYFNLGNGQFVDGGQDFYPLNYADYFEDVALGDLDNDGDLDAFLSKFQAPNEVWFNDGSGYFTFGYSLESGNKVNEDVSLGDLNNDGYLDAVVAVGSTLVGTNIYLNNGDGSFSNYQLPVDAYGSRGVSLGDIDADGDLDIVLAEEIYNKVWFNDGTGHFPISNTYQTNCHCRDIDVGDLNGDGSLDLFIPTNYCVGGLRPNKVYFNTDLVPPSIINTSPVNQSIMVPVTAPIVINFSEAIDPGSFTYTISPDPGGLSVLWNDTISTATLSHNDFLGETIYSITVTNATDLAGNPLVNAPYSWQFTTIDITQPQIISVQPLQNSLNVAVDALVIVQFNEAIDPTSFQFVSSPDPGEWLASWNIDNTTVTLTHIDFIGETTYNMTVLAATDLAGNTLSGSPYTWQFTTADITSPLILEVIPVVSAADVELNTPIMITFSEAIESSTFTYLVSPDPGGWTITWSENYEVVTLEHNDFQQSIVYYASILSAADLAGNPLADSPYVWEFTTKDTWIPVVIDIKPGDTINSIHNDGNGIIPVAIFGSATFNVLLIDPTTVYLDSQAVRAVGRSGNLQASYDDVNGDGYLDMVVQIEDIDGTYQEGDTIATLTGQTYLGQFFRGSDAIRIVP